MNTKKIVLLTSSLLMTSCIEMPFISVIESSIESVLNIEDKKLTIKPIIDINDVKSLTLEEKYDESYLAFKDSLLDFSNTFLNKYALGNEDENIVLSPLSIYMCLSMCVECVSNNTLSELTAALGMSYADILKYTSYLYREVNYSLKSNDSFSLKDTTYARHEVNNSLWYNYDDTNFNIDTINSLTANYYAESYDVDFANDNKNANKYLSQYIYDKTHGLIDVDLNLSVDTVLAILNTLYMKVGWDDENNELKVHNEKIIFNNKNGNKPQPTMLEGRYVMGRVYKTDDYQTFYTRLGDGSKFHFLIPTDGDVSKVLSKETLNEVARGLDYQMSEEKADIQTRIIFPEFTVDCASSVKSVLNESFNVSDLFNENCDASKLSSTDLYVSGIDHIAKLIVNRKGAEGAAITIAKMETTSIPNYTLYETLIVDSPFAFILQNRDGVIVFSGAMNNL